jgi:DNA polymerase-3 subunit delta
VQALIDYNRDTELDDAVAAVADRNLPALDATLTLLLREGTQPVAWIRALQRYFNRLYFIKSQMGGGQTAEQIIHSLRPPVFFKQVPSLTRHVQSWSLDQIVKALRLLVAAELACKTSDLPPFPASSRKLLQVTQAR